MPPQGEQQKNQWGVKTVAVVAFCFLVAGFLIGVEWSDVVPWKDIAPDASATDADLKPFFKAWELLDEHFVPATTTEKLSSEEKIWGAIQGLASAYGDPYTEFLPPKEKEIFESAVSGNFGGVGLEIDIKNDVLTVVAPLKDTPAYRAGIKSGDLIIEIDGVDTSGMTVSEAVEKIRGEEGTQVVLTIIHEENPPKEVAITRAQIVLPTVEHRLRNDGVFVIELSSFNAMAPDKFREALRAFADSGTDKLVIDLRGNPGGYLEVAVDIASWFLDVGKPVVIQDFSGTQAEDVFRSRGYDAFNDNLKLAVLIDEGSASASEILAGALRDHGEATLVGTKSFGKGSVQQVFEVTGDTSLKITIARWLTPKGVSISHEGITPDIVVERTREDVEADRDPQLDRAVEFLKTGK